MNNVKCMNPWDPQSKRQYRIDGVYRTLDAGNGAGGQAHGVCYAIEGNVVDRISAKNGKGWCEDVSSTLNTQDKHAVCFQLCGDRDNPSVSTSDIAYCIPANPMSDRGQAVAYSIDAMSSNSMKSLNPHSGFHETSVSKCLDTSCCEPTCNQGGGWWLLPVIAIEGNGSRPSHMGKGFSEDGCMYTLNTIEQHSVCYSIDCRNLAINTELSGTLQTKETGGWSLNYLNPVMYEK